MTVSIKERNKAHRIVSAAKAKGILAIQPCEVCGKEAVHAHHDDYSRPLDVKWLCPFHHKERHIQIGKPLVETAKHKTDRLKLTDDLHATLSEAAHTAHKSLHQFILDLLANAVK
jgi:hypothetical protein